MSQTDEPVVPGLDAPDEPELEDGIHPDDPAVVVADVDREEEDEE